MPTDPIARARYEAAHAKNARARAHRIETRAAAESILKITKAQAREEARTWSYDDNDTERFLERKCPEVRRRYPRAGRALNRFRGREVRALPARVVGRSPRAQLAFVARHLFARHAPPACMLDVFEHEEKWMHGWYLDLCDGRSVREVCSAFKMTRRAAHLFRSAPRALGPAGGVWWAKLRARGAQGELAVALAKTPLFSGEAAEGFLQRCADYLINHPPPRRDLGALCRYFAGARVADAAWSPRGRSLERMVAEARALYGDAGGGGFPRSGLRELALDSEHRVTELRSEHALRVEGRRQNHCVFDYRKACKHGVTSIFSLRRGARSVITLEVGLGPRAIVQARGESNRMPSDAEWGLVDRFAAFNSLRVLCRA